LLDVLEPGHIQKLIHVLRVSSEIDGLDDDDDVDDDNVDEENLHLLKLVVSDFTSIVLECSRKVVSHYPLTLRLGL
jgi:hypothetical protein